MFYEGVRLFTGSLYNGRGMVLMGTSQGKDTSSLFSKVDLDLQGMQGGRGEDEESSRWKEHPVQKSFKRRVFLRMSVAKNKLLCLEHW